MAAVPTPEVIRRAAGGDVRAQDAVFGEWLPVVLRWCARFGGSRIDPEDAAHDVFMVVLTRLDALADPSRFEAWLFGVTRRVLGAHRRRAWVKRWTGGDVPEVADGSEGADDRHARRQVAAHVHEILEKLPRAQREVLILCDVEERSAPEVAQLLDISVGTVASRLRLGREKFEKAARRRQLHVELSAEGTTS